LAEVSDPNVLRLSVCAVDLRTGELSGGRDGRLTPRQLMLLEQLVRDPGQVVSREALFEAFGYVAGTRSRAVDKAMNALRARIEADPAHPVNLVTVYGQGYVFHPSAEPVQAPSPPLVDVLRARSAPPDRFVGRVDDRARLSAALESPGLVTLVGPGGVGKTRLASELVDSWPSGGLIIELAAVDSRPELLAAVAFALQLEDAASTEPETIAAQLAARGGQLVVLDNLEHLTEHASVLAGWVARAPHTRLLATSRQPLSIRGEKVVRLEPLDRDSAAELLQARVAEAGHALGDQPLDELVGVLDGLPLALELAAARLDVLTPDQLVHRIAQGKANLRDPRRDSPSRFADLDALLEGSWVGLTDDARALLGDLSVFADTFDIDAAEAIATLPPDAVADGLGRLLDRSLVHRRATAGGLRFRLLETVRAFVRRRHPADALDAAFERHAHHFAARSGREADWLSEVRSALRRAVVRGDSGLAIALLHHASRGTWHRGTLAEARELADLVSTIPGLTEGERDRALIVRCMAIKQEGGGTGRARLALEGVVERAIARGDAEAEMLALGGLGVVDRDEGRMPESERHFRRGLELARSIESRIAEANLTADLGITLQHLGDTRAYETHLQLALSLHRELGDPFGVCMTLANLGPALYRRGDVEEARRVFEEALVHAQRLGQKRTEAMVRGNLGVLHQDQGRYDEALEHLGRALQLHREMGHLLATARDLMNLGLLHSHLGDHEPALDHLRTASQILSGIGSRRYEADALGYLGMVLFEGGELTEAREVLERASTLARETANRYREAVTSSALASLDLHEGAVESARHRVGSAIAILQELSQVRSEAVCRMVLAWVDIAEGDLRAARVSLEQSLPVHRQVGNLAFEGACLGLIAVLDAREGRIDLARRSIDAARDRLDGLADRAAQAYLLIFQAEIEALAGDPGAAIERLAEADRRSPKPQFEIDRHIARVYREYKLDRPDR